MTAPATADAKTWDDYAVGESVYRLAWIGKRFEVVEKTEQIMSLQGEAEYDPRGAQVDVVPGTLWMLTHEPWDQVWYWPDREGEGYEEVFERFIRAHSPGDIVNGYFFDRYLNPLGRHIDPRPDLAMTFRVENINLTDRRVLVRPVVGLVDETGTEADPITDVNDERTPRRWVGAGPAVPLTIEMKIYRWCLSVGPFVLNWEDFME